MMYPDLAIDWKASHEERALTEQMNAFKASVPEEPAQKWTRQVMRTGRL
jgi:hypothetical protein